MEKISKLKLVYPYWHVIIVVCVGKSVELLSAQFIMKWSVDSITPAEEERYYMWIMKKKYLYVCKDLSFEFWLILGV